MDYAFRLHNRTPCPDRYWNVKDVLGFLRSHPTAIIALAHPHSFRGYYDDLALELTEEYVPCHYLEKELGAMTTMEGYKGGTYTVHDKTRVWIANYGSGEGILLVGMEVTAENRVVLLVDCDNG